MENDLTGGERPRVAADKSAYIRSVKETLAQKRAALELVKHKVNVAVAAGRIARSTQLVNAERQAYACLLTAEHWLMRLSSQSSEYWEDSRFRTDIALEELTKSVKQMVSRIT